MSLMKYLEQSLSMTVWNLKLKSKIGGKILNRNRIWNSMKIEAELNKMANFRRQIWIGNEEESIPSLVRDDQEYNESRSVTCLIWICVEIPNKLEQSFKLRNTGTYLAKMVK